MTELNPMDNLVLGIDLGTNSLGWALLDMDAKKIVAAGSRVFKAAAEGNIEQGRDESPNVKRRQARQARRMLWRRSMRQVKVLRTLQRMNLLPSCDPTDSAARHHMLNQLDCELASRHLPKNNGTAAAHLLPYILRAKGLDSRLEPHALGRAVLHLAQRRGFLSNRKSAMKKDEDLGQVKESIAQLAKSMQDAGKRTLGEYFASLDPEQKRIRQRWTARQMYVDEFEKLWSAQVPHHPDLLTETAKKRLSKAIFHQRPLKSVRKLIGRCSLEPKHFRAPWASLPAQRFRLLQRVNDLTAYRPSTGEVLAIDADQRRALIETLVTQGDLSFAKVKSALGLPRETKFNLEEGGEKKLPGDRLISRLRVVFGNQWDQMPAERKDAVVADLQGIESESALERRGREVWGLSSEKAREFSEIPVEDSHCALSRKAMLRLIPELEKGIPFATAKKTLYPASPDNAQPSGSLPPVLKAGVTLRNPVVTRSLTELRKVVNAILREYGKPGAIRVELGRDLKKNRKQRSEIWKRNRQNESGRQVATEKIRQEAGITMPKPSDKEKFLLAEECGWQCPYTGKSFNMKALFGSAPEFDIEHIIPYSRSLDNSFLNKTICQSEENRNRKKNKTPYEAYAGTPEWEEILQRVGAFKGEAAREKLRRFRMTPDETREAFEDFSERQLCDTRYASAEATRFLGTLYGCRSEQPGVDTQGKRRIQVGAGQVTARLRNELGLNTILSDGGVKNRGDHRHHAVDAVAVALTDPGTVKMLADAAQRAPEERRRRFGRINPPWPEFLKDVRGSIAGIIVSHRQHKKLSGALHEETNYSPPKKGPDGAIVCHVRKSLANMTMKDVASIVDPAVRKAVMDKLQALGMKEPTEAFKSAERLPALRTKDGRQIPIKKARVRVAERPIKIGRKAPRHVMSGANHHMEVWEVKDKKGGVKWEGKVVTLFEACERLRAGKPVVQKDHGEGTRSLFTLAPGDMISLAQFATKDSVGKDHYVVRSVWTQRMDAHEYPSIRIVRANDARPTPEIKKAGHLFNILLEPLRKRMCQKVQVDLLGKASSAND